MKRKTTIITLVTLIMVICMATVAYAWTLSGWSSITPGLVTMKATSQSQTDVTASTISVRNQLYRDNILIGTGSNQASNTNFVEAIASGSNQPGIQIFDCVGTHRALYGGQEQLRTSYADVSY